MGRVDLRIRLKLPQEVIQDDLAAVVQLGNFFFEQHNYVHAPKVLYISLTLRIQQPTSKLINPNSQYENAS